MQKLAFFILSLSSLLSCSERLFTEQVDREKFCKYFNIRIEKKISNGRKYSTATTKINTIPNDEVSTFIKNHSHRFNYLVKKIFISEIIKDRNFDSVYLNNKFCTAISSDSFYQNFTLLTSGEKNINNKLLTFSIPEMMEISSRFFMCDNIQKSDTAISYHICVGINGISELKSARDYTVLEAFCFEAIFKNLNRHSKFKENFNRYIKNSSQKNLRNFESFETHLLKVKEECYGNMEKDEDLKITILKYYEKNQYNVNFKIK